jgi:CubicO group peptidase (beta-lactamase class C family)
MLIACVMALTFLQGLGAHAEPAKIYSAPSARLLIARPELESWSNKAIAEPQRRGQFVGGAIAVIGPDGPVLTRGYGFADHGTQDAFHPAVTWFPAADFGNLLLATLLIDLEEQDRLSLEGKVDNYLTRLSLSSEYDELSLQDLFGERSGLTSSVRGTHLYKDQDRPSNLDHIKSLLDIDDTVGENIAVSSLASALASLVIEDVTGKPVQAALTALLISRWGAPAWFNTQDATGARHISSHHRISPSAGVSSSPLEAVAPGFEATRGLYLSVNDMAAILSRQLAGLAERDETASRIAGLVFRKDTLTTTVGGLPRHVGVYALKSQLDASTLHAILIPDLEIGFLAVVNSSATRPNLLPGLTSNSSGRRASEKDFAILSASDLTSSFASQFIIAPQRQVLALPLESVAKTGLAVSGLRGDSQSALPRTRGFLTPLFQKSSLSGLTALFALSVILQFALMASARWPASTRGQTVSRWLGMGSVVFMTATLTFPFILIAIGHSPTLVDPLFLTSQWAFPVAGLLALATMVACLIGWRKKFWGEERAGFQKRLCYTVGSLGVFGLAIVIWELGLVIPNF